MTLPASNLPCVLGDLGYDLKPDGEGERILAGSIVERFARNAKGELVPWTEGQREAEMRTHAGITRVERFSFTLAHQDSFQRTIR